MKLYEYIAAGLPVLASRTSTMKDAGAQTAVFPYSSDSELVQAAEAALARGALSLEEAADLTAEVDWSVKAKELLAFLGSLKRAGSA